MNVRVSKKSRKALGHRRVFLARRGLGRRGLRAAPVVAGISRSRQKIGAQDNEPIARSREKNPDAGMNRNRRGTAPDARIDAHRAVSYEGKGSKTRLRPGRDERKDAGFESPSVCIPWRSQQPPKCIRTGNRVGGEDEGERRRRHARDQRGKEFENGI